MTAWKLPLVVSAIVLPIVAGFYVGGPGLGMAVGALAAAAIIVLAVRNPPLEEIVVAPATDARTRLLVVLDGALEPAGAVAIAALVEDALVVGAIPEVLLVAPRRGSFAERWASDLEPGRKRAQTSLEQGLSTLADLGVSASARVGDEDAVQMTEDTLSTFAATDLVLVDGGKASAQAAEALQPRLAIPVHRVQAVSGSTRAQRAIHRLAPAQVRS